MAKSLGNFGNLIKNCFHKIGGFFRNLKEKIAHNKLFVLVMMQLKDKWNISWKANKKAALFKLVGQVLIFAAMIAIVYFALTLTSTRLAIFMTSKIPFNAMLPILLVVVVFETISILIGLTRALFFSKDNVVLITYAVKFDYLFFSKLLVYYVDAIKKSFMLLLPLFISFGIIYGYGVGYFLFVIFVDLIFVLFLVLLCGILAIPTYYLLRFLEKFKIIKLLFAVAVLGLVVYGTILLIGLIPENINLIRQYEEFSKGLNRFLFWFRDHFFITKCLGHMFFGVQKGLVMSPFSKYSFLVLLVLIGVIGVLVLVNIVLSKPFYRRTISSSHQSGSLLKPERKNSRLPKWLSVLHYEFLRNFRNVKLVTATIICVVAMPLISLFTNRFYGSFSTRPIGDTLIYIFNFLFIMIVVCSHNVSSSFVFSKDGPSWTVNKTMPIKPVVSLPLRLVYNFVASIFIIVPSSIIFTKSAHGAGNSSVLLILTCLVISTMHSFMSAVYDFNHSKNKDKADIGSEIIENHSMVSLAYGFIISLFFCFHFAICAIKGSTSIQLRSFLLATVLLVVATVYFFRNIKLTFQEN